MERNVFGNKLPTFGERFMSVGNLTQAYEDGLLNAEEASRKLWMLSAECCQTTAEAELMYREYVVYLGAGTKVEVVRIYNENLREGDFKAKIAAIKWYRAEFGVGLKDSKNEVEAILKEACLM